MARQVFFDPFGSYTQGYDTGVQRETQMQDSTRRARAQDFNYNYMMPLEYKQAQRNDELGAFGLQYQKQALTYADQLGKNNVFNSNQAINKGVGTEFGITAPYENTVYQRFGITPSVAQYTTAPGNPNLEAAKAHWLQNMDITAASGVPMTPELRQSIAQQMATHFNVPVQDILNPIQQPATPQPQVTYMMTGPNGEQIQVGQVINPRQQLLDQWNRPQAMEQAQDIYGMNKDYYNALRQAEEARRAQAYLEVQQGYLTNRTANGGSGSVTNSVIPGAF